MKTNLLFLIAIIRDWLRLLNVVTILEPFVTRVRYANSVFYCAVLLPKMICYIAIHR